MLGILKTCKLYVKVGGAPCPFVAARQFFRIGESFPVRGMVLTFSGGKAGHKGSPVKIGDRIINCCYLSAKWIRYSHKSHANTLAGLLILSPVLILGVILTPISHAATYYVNGSCANDGDGTASTCAAATGGAGARKTIQAAVNQAAGGDVVKVVPYNYGTPARYTIYYENVVVTKAITLEADTATLPASGPPTAWWTIIDGDQDNDKVGDSGNATLVWAGGVAGTVRNLKIEGGFGTAGGSGAGILVSGEGTSVLVEDMVVRFNDHGIVVRYGATPTIRGSIIYYNDKSGIAVHDGSAPIIGGGDCGGDPRRCRASDANRIYRNSNRMNSVQCFSGGGFSNCEAARAEGCAAVFVFDASKPKIWGNRIYSNRFAGITATGQSAPSIKSNLIRGNGLVGLGLLSAGRDIEISGNWFEKNQHGIGVQSSGSPCSKIVIKDNDILRNTHNGIISCNAYLKIGGAAGDGNRIYDNQSDGINLSINSEAEISYNNILNNYYRGIQLFGSDATIEKNLIADNGCGRAVINACLKTLPREYGQIEVWGGKVKRVNNNIIVGGNYSGVAFEGVGILVGESLVFNNVISEIQEVRDNIISRLDLGIKINEHQGFGTFNAYRPGAVDRNLVTQWNSALYADGYSLGPDNSPGEQTYYYGEETGSYGGPAAYFFLDPDHKNPAAFPDFSLVPDVNSPVYTVSAYAGSPPLNYLGLPADFVYIDQVSNYNYKFQNSLASLSPGPDVAPPVIAGVVPPDGAVGVSRSQIITVYIEDAGDGIDEAAIEVDLAGGAGSCVNCPIAVSGNSSYLEVVHAPAVLLDAAVLYTVTVRAVDVRGNYFTGTRSFTTNTAEAGSPLVDALTPADGAVDVAVDAYVKFNVRDVGSGVDPDSIMLRVDGNPVTVRKAVLNDGLGVTPDYVVFYKPSANFAFGATVNLDIYAEDFEGNVYNGASSFTTAVDNVAPKDISKLRAYVRGAGTIELRWIPSEDVDCDIASFPYTLYTDAGSGYDSGKALTSLLSDVGSYKVNNLSEGTYNFMISVKDVLGNESLGTEITNVRLAVSTEFSDDYEGFYDAFDVNDDCGDGDLNGKWSCSGGASWQTAVNELRAGGADGELIINKINRGDYNYSARFMITSAGPDDAAWLLMRKIPASAVGSSGYVARIGLGSVANVGIYELSGTGTRAIETVDSTIGPILRNTWYNVRLVVEGTAVKLYLGADPLPADALQVLAIDSDNSYWDGSIGLWQPAGNGNVSYSNIEVDYNKPPGVYRYTTGAAVWSHQDTDVPADSQRDALLVNTGAETELLMDPLVLGGNFVYKTRFNITSGAAGLLARKTVDSAVGGSGYLAEIALSGAVSSNVKFYRMSGSGDTVISSGAYTVDPSTDYWVWLVGRGDNYQVTMGSSGLYSLSTPLVSINDSAFTSNRLAGIYALGGSRVEYDDLSVTADLSEVGGGITIIDATYNYSQVQAAIDAANPGDTIVFSDGVYDIGNGTITMKEGVNLKAKTVNACGAKAATITGTATLISAAGGAVIEGFELLGQVNNVGIWIVDDSPTVTNNEILNCYDAIRVGGVVRNGLLSLPNINNNCVHNNIRYGIANSFESSAYINNNQIYNNGEHGVSVRDDATPLITGNLVYANMKAGVASRGDSAATISQNNRIYGNIQQGVAVRDNASPTIDGNFIYKNLTDGIGVGCRADDPLCDATATPVINNNVIYSNLESGISMRSRVRPEISGNTIYNHIYTSCPTCNEGAGPDNSFGSGIRISDRARPVLGNNYIYSNSYGLSFNLEPAARFTVSGLNISRNGIGVHIGGDSAITLENSTLYSNYKFGIAFYGTAHPLIRNNEIRHNGDAAGRAGDSLKFMPSAGTGVGGVGVGFSAYPNITGNRIWGHAAEILINDDVLPAQGLPLNQIMLGGAASAVNDDYKGRSVYLLDGNGLPRVTNVIGYDGATKIATVSPPFIIPAAAGDRYRVTHENLGVAIRGNLRTGGNIPLVSDNRIYSNFMGIGIGSRDNTTDAPNPEVYSNDIYNNGDWNCPAGILGVNCGGGIGNRAASSAYIHDNTIYNNSGPSNYGVGVIENASPVIGNNRIYSSYRGIGVYLDTGDVVISSNSIYRSGSSGIEIEGSNVVAIRNNTVWSNPLVGMRAENTTQLTISGNLVYGNGSGTRPDPDNEIPPDAGIRFRAVNLADVTGNTIRDNNGFGIGVSDGSPGDVINITGNTVGGPGQGNTMTGVGVGRLNNPAVTNEATVTISGNTISYNGPALQDPDVDDLAGGVSFFEFAGTAFVDNNTIEYNRGDARGGGGIGIRKLKDGTINIGTIAGNTVFANLGGPDVKYLRCGGICGRKGDGRIIVSNNNVYGHTLALSGADQTGIGIDGIAFDGGGQLLRIGPDNTVHHNDVGIRVKKIVNAIISNNQIYSIGNGTEPILPDTFPPDAAIRLLEADEVTIDGNTIIDNKAYGITFADNGGGDRLYVQNNFIGSQGLPNELGGIIIGIFDENDNNARFRIRDNDIRYNSRSGISFTRANRVRIEDNTIVSNGLADYIDPVTKERDASGIRNYRSRFRRVRNNIIRHNKFSGIACNGGRNDIGPGNIIKFNGNMFLTGCTDLNGPSSGDAGISLRDLSGNMDIDGNTIASNYANHISRKDCNRRVREDGVDVPCVPYWDATDAAVLVDTDNTIVSGQTISGGSVWGIAIVNGAKNVVVRNCTIENNMPNPNTFGSGGYSTGGGILVGPDADARIYSNVIRGNGAQVTGSINTLPFSVDGDTTTEWQTDPADVTEPHWVVFDLGWSPTVTRVSIYAGSQVRTWNVYVTPSNRRYNPQPQDLVLSNWVVGGTPGWVQSPAFNRRERCIVLQAVGGPISDHFYEFQYQIQFWFWSFWLTPPVGGAEACSDTVGPSVDTASSGGIVMRCNNQNTQIWSNNIYNNIYDGINAREAKGGIGRFNGPNNIYNHERRGISVLDAADMAVSYNDIYLNSNGIGMSGVFGTVTITSNSVRSNDLKGIGLDGTGGDLALTISDNNLSTNNDSALSFQDSPDTDNLRLVIAGNNISASGVNGLRMQTVYNGTIAIADNIITSNAEQGIMFRDCGAAGSGLVSMVIDSNIVRNNASVDGNVRFFSNNYLDLTISSNEIAMSTAGPGLRFRAVNNSDVVISNNNVFSNIDAGIMFMDCVGTDLTISSNEIRDNGSEGLQFQDNSKGVVAGSYTLRYNNIHHNTVNGLNFQNNLDLDEILLFSNTVSDNGDGGIWFRFTENVKLEGNYITGNSGVGLRVQDCSAVIGSDSYIFSMVWSDLSARFYMADIFDWSQPYDNTPWLGRYWLRDKMEAESVPLGGNVVRNNGDAGIQLRGDTAPNNTRVRGGQVRDNATDQITVTGALADVTVYAVYLEGGGESLGVEAGAVLTVDNCVSQGDNAVQADGAGGTRLNIRNKSFVNEVVRTKNQGTVNVFNGNKVGCINNCVASAGGPYNEGSWNIEKDNYINGHFPISGAASVANIHNNNTFAAANAMEIGSGASVYIYNANQFIGGGIIDNIDSTAYLEVWGYQNLGSTADPSPNILTNIHFGLEGGVFDGNQLNNCYVQSGATAISVNNNIFDGGQVGSGWGGGFSVNPANNNQFDNGCLVDWVWVSGAGNLCDGVPCP